MIYWRRGRGVWFAQYFNHTPFQFLYGIFWLLSWQFSTVMVLLGVSFSVLIYYNEHIMRLKAYWKSNLRPSGF